MKDFSLLFETYYPHLALWAVRFNDHIEWDDMRPELDRLQNQGDALRNGAEGSISFEAEKFY